MKRSTVNYRIVDESLIEVRQLILSLISKQKDVVQKSLLEDAQRLLQITSLKVRDSESRERHLKEISQTAEAQKITIN